MGVNYIKKRVPRVLSCGFSLHYKRKTEREGSVRLLCFGRRSQEFGSFFVVVYLLLLHLLHGLWLEGFVYEGFTTLIDYFSNISIRNVYLGLWNFIGENVSQFTYNLHSQICSNDFGIYVFDGFYHPLNSSRKKGQVNPKP